MAKVNIAGIDIDVEAQRKNTPAERAAVFAHLKGTARTKAAEELEKALAAKPALPKPPEPAKEPAKG
jgi:hypothetical protein